MRLGILTFGTAPAAPFLDTTNPHDIDIVLGDASVTSPTGAKTQAERIARADPDAVLLWAEPDAAPTLIADAAQFIGVPLLVAGPSSPALFDSCGALTASGLRFDRLPLDTPLTLDAVLPWLNENARSLRQPGYDAALKLYGQTLHVSGPSITLDAARWRQQFGIRITLDVPTEDAPADFTAPDGDALSALCHHLLHLVSNRNVGVYPYGDALPPDATFAQLAPRAGKFQMLLAPPGTDWPALAPHLFAGKIFGATGNHLSALRAACQVLDVDAVLPI